MRDSSGQAGRRGRQRVAAGPEQQPWHIDPVRGGVAVGLEVLRAAPKQRGRARRIASRGVRQPDRELSQPAPQFALGRWCRLPCVLEDLVRVERAVPVEQALRLAQGLLGRTNDALWLALDAGSAALERPAESVTRSRAAGPAGGITIAFGCHAPILPVYLSGRVFAA
jgi:hypothetical protein